MACWSFETWQDLKKKGKVEDEDDDLNPGMSTKVPKPNDGVSTTSCYMEDKNGEQQPEYIKDAARATARGFWIKLLNEGKAPTHFGILDLYLKNEYISMMEREYPWLRYCTNHWKAEQLWRNHYPPWYGPAMKKEAKRKAKEAAEKAAAEGRVINVDSDNDSDQGGQGEPSKRPRSDDETINEPKRHRVEDVKSTPLAPPARTTVTTKRVRVHFFTQFGYILY